MNYNYNQEQLYTNLNSESGNNTMLYVMIGVGIIFVILFVVILLLILKKSTQSSSNSSQTTSVPTTSVPTTQSIVSKILPGSMLVKTQKFNEETKITMNVVQGDLTEEKMKEILAKFPNRDKINTFLVGNFIIRNDKGEQRNLNGIFKMPTSSGGLPSLQFFSFDNEQLTTDFLISLFTYDFYIKKNTDFSVYVSDKKMDNVQEVYMK